MTDRLKKEEFVCLLTARMKTDEAKGNSLDRWRCRNAL
jgi:hypothetical protein